MALQNQWRKGPITSIVCQPAHGQPVFSLALGKNNFVTGSADHGLREYNIESGKYVRELYGKKYGHKEWVSSCFYTPSGRVISGGMDSMVCFWQSKAVKCEHFAGHQQIEYNEEGVQVKLGISGAYDASIILWDLLAKKQSQRLIGPHKQAIMDFQWVNSLLASGDKSGVVAIWDLNKCKMIKAIKTHKGAAANIKFHQKLGLFSTCGLNDGTVASFDMRTNSPIFRKTLHKGAVNSLKVVEEKGLLISSSASGTISVLQAPNFQQINRIDTKNLILNCEQAYGVIIAATIKNILAYDLYSGQLLYGFGAMKKGDCRLLGINQSKTRLICAGEDESATILVYK